MNAFPVFVASVAIATIAPVTMAIFGIGLPLESSLGFFSGDYSQINDHEGDAEPVFQYSSTSIMPEVKGYHDVVGASVAKVDGRFLLTINLAGDPNLNEKYETNYMWNLIYSELLTGEHYYTVMLVNFAPEFNLTSQGWYYAVYDGTAQQYVLPQTKISEMPPDRVEFSVDEDLIGNPSSFRYWVGVYSRVDNTSFDQGPEYLMDYAP